MVGNHVGRAAIILVLGLLSLGLVAPVYGSGFATTLNLQTSSSCATIGQTFALTATMRNNTNLAVLPGKAVIFQYALNSSSFGTLGNLSGYNTDSQGQAHLSFTARFNGSYLFRAVYTGGTYGGNFFSPGTTFNGSISQSVLIQTSNQCGQSSGCGFLGFGCFFSTVGGWLNGIGGALNSAVSGALKSLAGAFGAIGFWLNPVNWLNALGLGFIWNGFLYFVEIFLFLVQIISAILPYLGFMILLIHLYYIVRLDFEGLMGFWQSLYSVVSVVADAIFNFVQIVIDLVQSISGGAGGGLEGAAAAAA